MQINLPNSGTFFFISGHCHVIENVSETLEEDARKLKLMKDSGVMVFLKDGWRGMISMQHERAKQPKLTFFSDHPAWFQSTQRLKRLEATTRGRVIPGHDKETFLQLQNEIKDYLS